eukprot:3989599-Alexandrium_andersonii.AAC.1
MVPEARRGLASLARVRLSRRRRSPSPRRHALPRTGQTRPRSPRRSRVRSPPMRRLRRLRLGRIPSPS